MSNKVIEAAKRFMSKSVLPFVRAASCEFGPEVQNNFLAFLTGATFLKLVELTEGGEIGNRYTRISPYALGTSAVKILDREENGWAREITIWVDSAVGGPNPTVRVGDSSVTTTGGGFRVPTGGGTELGKIAATKQLYAIATSAINAYIIERA